MQSIMDEKGNRHFITGKIGTDGQGILYATKNKDIILRDAEGRVEHAQRYDNAKLLPLSEIENLLLPMDCLKEPNIGYTLNIPNNFAPLSTIMNPGGKPDFYIKTGGFKRRLEILTNISKILIKLHSLPCIYGSMSPNRIFISSKVINGEAFLLYSVKIDFIMNFAQEKDSDTYIAPEASRGRGGGFSSDSFAFGALSGDLLTMDGAYDIVDPKIKELLKKSQSEPSKRPKMSEFYKTFFYSLDSLVSCKKCHNTFFYKTKLCPNCQNPVPKLIKAVIYDKVGESNIERAVKILEIATHRQCFFNYHTDIVLLDDDIVPRIDCMLNVSADRKLNLIFKNLMDKEISVNDKSITPSQATLVPLKGKMIRIKFKLYSKIERHIDMVMI